MKSLILTLLCFVLANKSIAQYQSLFGQNSTQWIFEWHNLGIDEQDTVYVDKDTFAFGQNWKKVLTTRWPNQFKGALIREDTSIGKVWYKGLHYINSIDDTLEFLAFDFSLILNDTFNIDNMYSGKGGTTTIDNTVDSIYYISNIKHIRFKWILNSGAPFFEPFTFIEGIGGIMGVLYKQYSGGLQAQYLLCTYKDGIQTYYANKRYSGNCNIYPNSIDDFIKLSSSIQLFPNPSSTNINIKYDRTISTLNSFTIYDLQGNFADKKSNTDFYDCTQLKSGSYIINLKFNNQITIHKLFQKQ